MMRIRFVFLSAVFVTLVVSLTLLPQTGVCQRAIVSEDVDRTFDLNITEERIVEANFERSTAISVKSRELRVHAGALASAGRIDVTLKGVTGRVTFRASLGPLRESLRRLLDRVEQGSVTTRAFQGSQGRTDDRMNNGRNETK